MFPPWIDNIKLRRVFAAPHSADLSASSRRGPGGVLGLGHRLGETTEGPEVDVGQTEAGGGPRTLKLSL